MKQVEAHPEAEHEFHEAVEFYEGRVEGLGAQYRGEIEDAVERLRQRPESYPIYEGTECREIEVWRFPFCGLLSQ